MWSGGAQFWWLSRKRRGKARCYLASHTPMLIWRAQHTRGVVPSEKWNINTRVGPLFLDEDWHGNSRGLAFWVPKSTRVNKFFAVSAFCASVTLWKIHVRAIYEILGFFFFNVDVQTSLRVFRLISRVLKFISLWIILKIQSVYTVVDDTATSWKYYLFYF